MTPSIAVMNISRTGLTALYCPERTETLADIVFVHGLQGHPLKTWTANGVCWPKDLLPDDVPDCRILTFGYDSIVTTWGTRNPGTVPQYATDLLLALAQARVTCPNRPIIFVAHSMGGQVVKSALRTAGPGGNASGFETSVRALIFLGVPHRGSQLAAPALWAVGLVELAAIVGLSTNRKNLQALQPGTQEQVELSEDFHRRLDRLPGGFQVKTFQEGRKFLGLCKVVPDYSSCLGRPSEDAEVMDADHRDMVRFTSKEDPGYHQVGGWICAAVERLRHPEAGPSCREKDRPDET
ncbi:esterase/lipase family protein [Aspergillus ibericus CBS 121593]|uniref:AB hydrolase-1 domain-containing protein n=1 Tax=Aspergillus ibericus CBS 121593 TaxID=1448316 RepID=A0A395HCI8_9EURO|nr:hypothetical protein BO80DRAFT_442511 [Aspergillus ibericus CBS 121593]RAL03944.1 hypothetical protein BO80DRAFT_442511 [Aspergillus ibericus CBS 121593]